MNTTPCLIPYGEMEPNRQRHFWLAEPGTHTLNIGVFVQGMNARIRLESLDTSPCKELIDKLARRWKQAKLPASVEGHGEPSHYGD